MPLTRRQIPNAITMARAAMAVAFFVVLSFYRAPSEGIVWLWIAVALFIAAAATDVLDGWLARRWHVVSLFGRIMDPLCDKLLILGGFAVLAGARFSIPVDARPIHLLDSASGVYTWVVVVLLARELLVTAIRSVAESKGVAFPAKAAGKFKMFVQSLCLPLVMITMAVAPPETHPTVFWINHVAVWITVLITVWSSLPYIAAIRTIEQSA